MKTALIGHTGFVGSNLLRQQPFGHCYNSRNIGDIDGQDFDRLICAGVSAVKWWANQNPEQDRAAIQRLEKHLDTIRVKQFILISTVDVYPYPVDVDESSVIDIDACHPYGRHRLELEAHVRDRFDATIVRLPGLFGHGLKKNIIYDFLNNNNVEQINPNGAFQFYYLEHLSRDLERVLEHDIRLININAEPLTVQEVAEVCLGRRIETRSDQAGGRYDYKSRYDELFGGGGGYLYRRRQVLDDLRQYTTTVKMT